MTARIRASAIEDPELRRIYETTYSAFRRRRSLLLLDLQSQVLQEELPWIAAISQWVGDDAETRAAARSALQQAAQLYAAILSADDPSETRSSASYAFWPPRPVSDFR